MTKRIQKLNSRDVQSGSSNLLTIETAAAQLGIAAGTLRNWISARRIPYVKIGRLTRLRQSMLDAYVAAHTVPAVEDF